MATLTVRPGKLREFEAYERSALAIAARHDGRIERTIRSTQTGDGEVVEVHLLSFPDRASFDTFREDPALHGLGQARQAAIARTELLVGVAGPEYSTSPDTVD